MEWIKVADRLPEDESLVLVTNESPTGDGGMIRVITAQVLYDHETETFYHQGYQSNYPVYRVTHWMPYPTPAKD